MGPPTAWLVALPHSQPCRSSFQFSDELRTSAWTPHTSDPCRVSSHKPIVRYNPLAVQPRCTASVSPRATSSVSSAKTVATDLTTETVLVDELSPMIQHYVQTKRRLSASLCHGSTRRLMLMYRVGDFFESFFEDAHLLSSTCSMTLTSKDAGKALGARIPMAGVPHHAADSKIRTLIAKDITVAVVDQVQPSSQAASGELVRRAITRLITPATVSEDALLDARRSVYIAALVVKPPGGRSNAGCVDEDLAKLPFGFAYADVSTGEFKVTEGTGLDAIQRVLVNIAPSELLLIGGPRQEGLQTRLVSEVHAAGTSVVTNRKSLDVQVAEEILNDFHGIDNVESIGCRQKPFCIEAAAALLMFIREALAVDEEQGKPLPLSSLKTFGLEEVMLLDAACLRNMEVVETVRDGSMERSLQWAVDRTVTSMGARCLRSWLLGPSLQLDVIKRRQDIVEALLRDTNGTRELLQLRLRKISDLQRLSGRVGAGRASPREVRALAESLLELPFVLSSVKACMEYTSIPKADTGVHSELLAGVDAGLIRSAKDVHESLVDPAPSSLLSEVVFRGGSIPKENWELSAIQIFRQGYNDELDTLRNSIEHPGQWLSTLEEVEKKRTGIDSLRIKHIKNTGYVLRIPRSVGEKKMDLDPMCFVKLGYERVQSTKAELRFRFEELKVQERMHSSAFSEVVLLELRLFNSLLEKLSKYVQYIRKLGSRIASIDVLCGFAQVAQEQDYTRPSLFDTSTRMLDLEGARHPVVEQTLPVGRTFVSNSFHLGGGTDRDSPDLMVLCGPNAAGKSCALRSVGLICILAQTGSFVPAMSATLSLCDRIFTRVGAVDDLARGQSTFQVEMAETACILSHATSSSLVLLDEIGRGTSTVDGIAIAWSVSEHLAKMGEVNGAEAQPPRAIFVTHYHELNQLATLHSNVESFRLHMEKKEVFGTGGKTTVEWITTHKVVPGASFESLGLAVARRAGFPKTVIERAENIAELLQSPSKMLGAELRKALSSSTSSTGGPNVSVPNTATGSLTASGAAENGCGEDSQSAGYEAGYDEGYRKAREEVHRELQSLLAKLDLNSPTG